jgi:hypothetical protein
MNVVNIHERNFNATPEQIGALIDSLASRQDALWPWHSWPRMEFDRPLAVGALGGHGPIRYFVQEYVPTQSVRFQFTGPRGFEGFHEYRIERSGTAPVVLRHTLLMDTHGRASWSWPLFFRPLHNALIEDSLATAESSLGHPPRFERWSLWVRFLRWVIAGGRARPQQTAVLPTLPARRVKTK